MYIYIYTYFFYGALSGTVRHAVGKGRAASALGPHVVVAHERREKGYLTVVCDQAGDS